jgi:hypothetical protein
MDDITKREAIIIVINAADPSAFNPSPIVNLPSDPAPRPATASPTDS